MDVLCISQQIPLTADKSAFQGTKHSDAVSKLWDMMIKINLLRRELEKRACILNAAIFHQYKRNFRYIYNLINILGCMLYYIQSDSSGWPMTGAIISLGAADTLTTASMKLIYCRYFLLPDVLVMPGSSQQTAGSSQQTAGSPLMTGHYNRRRTSGSSGRVLG